MLIFEWVLAMLLGSVLLAALARRVGAPYPAFLALGGMAVAFVPGGPTWTLQPDLALALFVAPVLLDAAYDASPRDLRDNWRSVTSLVLVAVGLTTAAVAVVVHALVPGIPWAAAVALGAAVAPPDAAAATSVLRQVRPPHRILVILEGESLLNDASALLIYRLAVGAVGVGFSLGRVAPTFALAVVGSVAGGVAAARLVLRFLPKVQDVPSAIVAQFGTTFAVWILAEHLGLSGVLTIVAYAITAARSAPALTPARVRVPAYAVWDTVVFVLNVLAFTMIGLQVRPIWSRLPPPLRVKYGVVAGAVLLTVIVVRFAWVMTYNTAARLGVRRYGFHPPRPMMAPTVRGGLVIAWCGMRGIVTLAAAFALPDRGPSGPFPFRDLILLTAFCVVLGTLVLQGLTLRPLLERLRLTESDPVRDEVARARAATLRAALESIADETSPQAEALRGEYRDALERTEREPESAFSVHLAADPLRRRAVDAARRRAYELRDTGEIGDDAFHRIEEELDRAELSAAASEGA